MRSRERLACSLFQPAHQHSGRMRKEDDRSRENHKPIQALLLPTDCKGLERRAGDEEPRASGAMRRRECTVVCIFQSKV